MNGANTVYSMTQDSTYKGQGWWSWSVWMVATEEALNQVEYVEYTLHSSFLNPVRRIDNRFSNFRLDEEGWGGFTLYVRVQLKDGEQVMLNYELRLMNSEDEVVSKGLGLGGPTLPLVRPLRERSLTVPGKVEEVASFLEPESPQLMLETMILVAGGQERGESDVVTIGLRDDHVIELQFDDGTNWLCGPDALEELYPGILTQQRGEAATFRLPGVITGSQTTRGLVDQVALKVLKLYSRTPVRKGMAWLAGELEEKQLGGLRGLVKVTETFELLPLTPGEVPGAGPVLLFIHGTNSSAKGSFAELVSTDLWSYITAKYKNNVLAFQHETLTKSPLQNAVELIGQLPPGIELHVITHSRGGLVGEILARCSVGEDGEPGPGFSEAEIAWLEKEGRGPDVSRIRQLKTINEGRRFKVSKFVRVACPTGGTTILSSRLDHFFNISLNVLGFATGAAANPVYGAMKELLTEAIDQKNDPDVLPGLEAMRPDSPFITVLNNQGTSIGLPVVAISGNCQAKVNFKALLIIAERVFFSEPNDLVVNTASMYAGSQRRYKLQYFFDQGTDVDHFHYFKNKRTNAAILFALQSTGDERISGFADYFRGGPAVAFADVQLGALPGVQGGGYVSAEPSGKRPIVVLLPGFLGSGLVRDGENIWINYPRILGGALTQLGIDVKGIEAPAMMEDAYKELGSWLSVHYDVVGFPFDWRLSPQAAAALLAEKIGSLLALGQAVKLVAHSSGGVVVRDLMIFYPEVWKLLNASAGFRLIFLGAPLLGSFRIVNLLLGEDDIIQKLSKLDLLHTRQELVQIFNRFPGILALLPLSRDAGHDLGNWQTWLELVAAKGDPGWPVPVSADLRQFSNYRDRVMLSMDGLDLRNAVYIAGQHAQTPCGYRIDAFGSREELVLLSTAEGDQFINWDSSIPAAMDVAGNVYYVNHPHGELARSADMFAAIGELLDRGRTELLSRKRPMVRGEMRFFRKPRTGDFDLSPEGTRNTLLGIGSSGVVTSSELPLRVSVTHGDVKFARYPVLAGHFRYDSILYAEKRIDQLLDGQLEQRQSLGIYPGDVGTCEVVLTYVREGFHGAIIIGLGEQDGLTGYDLSVSAQQAAVKYLLIVNGRDKHGTDVFHDPIGISSLLIGCGYGGLSIETVVVAILQGVVGANGRISALFGEKARLLTEVEFIELYQDRALGCYYAVRRAGLDSGGALKIIAVEQMAKRQGRLQKVEIDQGRDWWNRITISKDGQAGGIRYSLVTGEAREEQEELFTAGGILDGLVESISTDNRWSEEKATTVFELLIPGRFKSRFKQHGNITLVLDKVTAGYPWELLQHKGAGVKPLCIHAGMIRQLATGDSRLNIEGVAGETALVIGDPQLGGLLPQLDGAYEEGRIVADLFKGKGYQTRALLRMEQEDIITALMSGSYKMIHLAAHGIFSADPTKPSGMVIGKESFLGTAQLSQMSNTPDLVFVNCCYLGKTDAVAEQYYRSRFKLAANIGTQLIENGVKAVIVAGWAVEDVSAQLFARVFYEQMFEGIPFGEAVRRAREAVYNTDNRYNTWGAYQCYGNPWYRLRKMGRGSQVLNYVIAEQAEADLRNLESEINMGGIVPVVVLDRMKAISEETERSGVRNPQITALEAMIYKRINQYDLALQKYDAMLRSTTGGYSFTDVEQYCNLRAKLLRNRQEGGEAAVTLEPEYDGLIKDLQALILLSQTAERSNLLASTWKRRCSLYMEEPVKLANAIRQSADSYREAYGIDATEYAYTNWVSMERVLDPLGDKQDVVTTLDRMKAAFDLRPLTDDFWARIVPANLLLTKWLINTSVTDTAFDLERQIEELVKVYGDIWDIASSPDDRMVEVQHLLLLASAVKGLGKCLWLAERITLVASALEARAKGQ